MKLIAGHFHPLGLHMEFGAMQETEVKIFLAATRFQFLKKERQ
jgi:hypothetical protein